MSDFKKKTFVYKRKSKRYIKIVRKPEDRVSVNIKKDIVALY